MARFHPLEVVDIRKDARDAVVLTLRPQDDADFSFVQGQYLTFRRDFDGAELRRSYSICAGLDDGALRVGIRRVEGGTFSTWANEDLRPGDVIEAMPPMGAFHAPLSPRAARQYALFAGGSGITPILSLIRTILSREPKSAITLVYGNRSINTIMFREELEDLKNTHLGRLSVLHVLESEGDMDLFTGRIDAEKCARLFRHWITVRDLDMAFICGPEPMMLAVSQALKDHGLDEAKIRFELFAASQPGRAPRKAASGREAGDAGAVTLRLTLDGATREIEMARADTVLDAALAQELDAPYACKAGICSTCRAMVLEGEVEMEANHALEDYEVRAGYVLTCQCRAISDRIAVSFDR